MKELNRRVDSLSKMIHSRNRSIKAIRQVVPYRSLPNSYIVAGEWKMPSRKDQKEFAEAAKMTPSMQFKEYELHNPDDESDYTEDAHPEKVDPQKGVKASTYAILKETWLEPMPIEDNLGFIAIFRLSKGGVFECLHSFNLPNLLMTQIENAYS